MRVLNNIHQRGLSMVELLVALAISSFLILGITQVYIDNKRNYIFQQSQASNQESARFAELTLNSLLNKAGYRRLPDQTMSEAFKKRVASGGCAEFVEGSVITDLSDDEIGFCMRYQPASTNEIDCQGDQVKAINGSKLDIPFEKLDASEVVILAIKFELKDELNAGTLQCKNVSGKSPGFVELLDGIADARIEFAVGGNTLQKKLEDQPWSSDATGMVRAVRYSMLLASRPNQRDGNDSKVYQDWYGEAPKDDQRRIYQQAGSTQVLRNMMP